MRKLLELNPDVYSDLQVLQRAREDLQEVIDDDRIEQGREDELLDDDEL